MAFSEEIRDKVRNYYVHQCLPIDEASRLAGVSAHSGRRWKKAAKERGDDWDRSRAASFMAGQGAEGVMHDVLSKLVVLTNSTLEALQTAEIDPVVRVEAISRLSDAYNKTANAVTKTTPKLSELAVAMKVLDRLSKFVAVEYPHHLEAFAEILGPFGKYISRELG